MTREVCLRLVCVFCLREIEEGQGYGCDVYDGSGQCWHADCGDDDAA
jgi:hypothetical protein